MALKQRLDQRQIQRLILAPALQQAIKLLPLTNLELIDVIDEELSQNPMLEIEEDEVENREAPQPEASAEAGAPTSPEAAEVPEQDPETPSAEPELDV